MKKFLLLVLLAPLFSGAQNLVPNPGFEIQDTCPAVSEIRKAPPWNSPSLGTPDLFNNNCASQNGPGRTGFGSSGIFVITSFPDSREYLQVRLTAPLQAGLSYCVEFYAKRSNFKFASDRLGAYLSDDSVYMTQTDPLNFTPQVANPLGNYIRSTSTWTKVSGNFVANGGERYLIIGNFYDDANTVKDSVGSSTSSNVAYYKIDDVSVMQCATGIEEASASIFKIYPNPSTDVLMIQSAELIKSWKAFASDGSLVAEANNADNNYQLNTSSLASGIYMLQLETNTGIVFKKFSVHR